MTRSPDNLKLYAAPRTRSIRVAWLLEELGLDYEIILDTFIPTPTRFFIQKTPTGKYPTIDDNGFIMLESGAILEYLIERYGEGQLMPPPGTTDKARCMQWIHFADATAFSPLGIVIWLVAYRDDASNHPQLVADATNRAATAFELLERELSGKQYLLGDMFSAADIMMGFTLLAARMLGIIRAGSNLSEYLSRLEARPAFQRALSKTGGGFSQA